MAGMDFRNCRNGFPEWPEWPEWLARMSDFDLILPKWQEFRPKWQESETGWQDLQSPGTISAIPAIPEIHSGHSGHSGPSGPIIPAISEIDSGCFLYLFGDVFLMLSGGGRNVYVDNVALVKCYIFHALPTPEHELCLYDDFRKLANTFHK